jgi:hypothetical protein
MSRRQMSQIGQRNQLKQPAWIPAGPVRGVPIGKSRGRRGGSKTRRQKAKRGKKTRKGKKTQRGGYRAVYKNARRRSTRKTSSS